MISTKAYTQFPEWIEREIRKHTFGKSPATLYEPIRYLMALGGKRLRPMLALLAYSMYKSDTKRVVPYAVAIEVFHNFTLVHDDIMDKAPLRRGKATVHKKWNVNTAILSGDVMQVKVYDMLLKLDAPMLKQVLAAFNKCAVEVCEGQQWDMEFETSADVSEQAYINMIRLKTAVLLGFSLQLGGMLAGAPAEDQKLLREFGINVGIGFQLKDDLLDAYADPKKFGKQVGGDIIANKKTFLLIHALEKASAAQRKELDYWLQSKKFNKREKVSHVLHLYNELGVPPQTEKKIAFYFGKAFAKLEKLSVGSDKIQILGNFTRDLINRQQ